MLTLFVFDMLFVAYLLILIGGLSTTYCLYKLAVGEFALSDRKRLDYTQLEIREEKQKREKEDEKLKKLAIENYTEIIEIKDELSKLQKMITDNEKT
jgi:hypothetical protein